MLLIILVLYVQPLETYCVLLGYNKLLLDLKCTKLLFRGVFDLNFKQHIENMLWIFTKEICDM